MEPQHPTSPDDLLRSLVASAAPTRARTDADLARLSPRIDALAATPPVHPWPRLPFVGASLVVGALTLAAMGARLAAPTSAPPAHVPRAAAPRSEARTFTSASAPVGAAPEAPHATPAVTAAATPTATPPVHGVAPVVHAGAASDLTAELRAIDEARASLDDDPARALRCLTRVARAVPRGQLLDEREALRIEALLRLERADEARSRFEALARRAPRSPQVARLGPLVGRAR